MQNFVGKTKCIVGYMKVADALGKGTLCPLRCATEKRICMNWTSVFLLEGFGNRVLHSYATESVGQTYWNV